MPLPGFLTKIFGGKVAEIATSITDGLDKLFTSKEEKLAAELKIQEALSGHLEKMEQLAQSEVDMYLKDVQDARANNTKIQESDKASWLSKNVGYIIDLFLAALWGTITVILFLKIFKITATDVDMVSLLGLHGTVTAVFMTVVNFHRGSSRGSEDKSKELKELRNK